MSLIFLISNWAPHKFGGACVVWWLGRYLVHHSIVVDLTILIIPLYGQSGMHSWSSRLHAKYRRQGVLELLSICVIIIVLVHVVQDEKHLIFVQTVHVVAKVKKHLSTPLKASLENEESRSVSPETSEGCQTTISLRQNHVAEYGDLPVCHSRSSWTSRPWYPLGWEMDIIDSSYLARMFTSNWGVAIFPTSRRNCLGTCTVIVLIYHNGLSKYIDNKNHQGYNSEDTNL